MATFNGANYVAEQVRSIQAQTRGPDVLVIVDDQSTDETVEILRSTLAESTISYILHRNHERQGIPRVFETALRLAMEFDVICLCDQDDVWRPEKLMVIEDVFLRQPDTEIVFSNAELVDEGLRPTGWLLMLDRRSVQRLDTGKGLPVLIRRNIVTGAAMAIRSRLLAKAFPIPSAWIHDGWLAVLAAAQGAKIHYLAQPLFQYRQHRHNYIGMERDGFISVLRRERARTAEYYQRQLSRYTSLLERLKGDDCVSGRSLRLVHEKVTHLRRRQQAGNADGLRKLRIIAIELLRLRYFRLSNGLVSALRELLV